MVIAQGDVVWVDFARARGSTPAGRRPALVIQHDRFNASRIATAVVIAITSTMRLADLPGNVRLRRGEGGLARPSVVNVTQLATVDRSQIGASIGQISRRRLLEIWAGLRLVIEPEAA